MAPREMKEYMAAQMQAIIDAYENADPIISLDDFANGWIEVNAQAFRQTYAIERL